MKIFFVSLGCDKNLVDSEQMLALLLRDGHTITDDESEADVIVINTCCFIGDAKEESIEAILEYAKYKESNCKALIVAGCLATRYKDEILEEIPEIDAIIGTTSTDKIVEAIDSALKGQETKIFDDINRLPMIEEKRVTSTGGYYEYLKISEGCDKHCTYCIIPKVRGNYRSYPMDYIVKQAEQLAESGVKELILVGQEVTMYGVDLHKGRGKGKKRLAELISKLAKVEGIAVFLVGHVTKEGVVAGPKTLEHMVDTVLYFEGDQTAIYRILRGVKNRFGSTNEIGVFEMKEQGLVEVENPSKVMLDGRPTDASGSVVVCSMEGTRPLLIEIQALVSPTSFNMPRRTTVGIDFNRVNLLLAVLEKKAGMQLGGCDAYVNLAGGMKLGEPAIDLGIICAVVSSYRNLPVHEGTLIFGEVGLTGEVRGVSHVEQRLAEAIKMGFTRCIMPKTNAEVLGDNICQKIQVIGVSNVREVIQVL